MNMKGKKLRKLPKSKRREKLLDLGNCRKRQMIGRLILMRLEKKDPSNSRRELLGKGKNLKLLKSKNYWQKLIMSDLKCLRKKNRSFLRKYRKKKLNFSKF